ncbi:MAG: xanthine dehydrogenase family protein molybdopterin-binding subunit [Actinomycetales bacterium]
MTAVSDAPTLEFGASRARKEDEHLLTGRTQWTDNVVLPGMLHIAFLRSPVAHATISSIDVSEARSQPGVIAAYTGADFADKHSSLPCAWPVTEDTVIPNHPAIATTEVHHVGEIVAAVVARSKAEASDALEAIVVDYDDLPAVLDMEAAIVDGSPLAHTDGTTNKSYTWVFDSASAGTGRDVDDVIREAEAEGIVIRRRYRQQRLIPAFMEPRSVVVAQQGSQWTMWSSTQVPHFVRLFTSLLTGTPEHELRVIAPDVGGGFGGKLQVIPEEIATFMIGQALGKPVKYTESRSESLMSGHHGRDQIQDLTLTATKDGRITGFKVDLLADMGAYFGLVTPGVPILGAFMFNSIYKMDAYRFTCSGVITNKAWTDAYRGAGRPEATYAVERMVDELAVELGIDPLEVRERNWIKHDEFPFATVASMVYDSGNYEAATAKAKDMFGYDALRAEQRERRERGDTVQLGLGISTYTEMCGLAPSRVLGNLRYAGGGWETATIRVHPTGKVDVITGASAHGQGHETAFSQIVADQIGVAFEDVTVLHGDTLVAAKGLDTYGSRSLAVGGIALFNASAKVRQKAAVMAAHMMECDPGDVEFVDGAYRVKGAPAQSKTLAEIAFTIWAAHDNPEGIEASLDSEATFDPDTFSFPHGTHLCAVEVDTETGRTKIRSYVSVDDIGNVVNPVIVEGQVHGGIAQGIAQALFEEAVHDDAGNLVTGTFVDYLLPSAADLPHFTTDRTETPATSNPLGVKGVGEAGTIASTPAVVNAIVDALRPFGVNDVDMPCTPERVWRAIHSGGSSSGGAPAAEGTIAYGGAQTGSSDGGAA